MIANAAARLEGALPGPLTGVRLYVAAILIGLGNFLVVLDTTIANVSIPTIAGNLGVSSAQGTWVINSMRWPRRSRALTAGSQEVRRPEDLDLCYLAFAAFRAVRLASRSA